MLKNSLQSLNTIANHKNYWLILAAIGIAMEVIALLYQYAGGYEPCILCIHTRIWVMGFIVLALLAYFLRHLIYVIPVMHLLITGMMVGLLDNSWELLQTERGNILGSCSFFLDMPAWFALDQWFPAMFEVRASCAQSPELLFGITMAEGLVVFSVVMVSASLALTLSAITGKR